MTGAISRRSALTGGLGLAASGFLAACSGRQTRSSVAQVQAVSGEMVIGANLELSGVGSTLGKLQERALQIGSQVINTSGFAFGDERMAVRVVIRDNSGDPEIAAEVSEQLINRDKVSAIIGGTTVETARRMLQVAEERKVPLLCLNSGDDMTFPLPQRKFVYKLAPNATDVAGVIARHIRSRGITSAAILATSDGHGDAGMQALPRALSSAGVSLAQTVRLPGAGRAFSDSAEQIASSAKAKAVVIWALAPVSAAAAAALRTAGFAGEIFLDSGAGADETLRGPNGSAVEGALIAHPSVLGGAPMMATTTTHLAARDFIYRYIQQYGAFTGFAPYAADALNLLTVAARRATSLDPQRIRGRLEAGAMEGISGAYAFQPISHGGLEPDALVVFVAHQGEWVRV